MRLPQRRGGLEETHALDDSDGRAPVVVQRWWRPHQKSEEIWATGAAVLRWLQSAAGPKGTDQAAASAIANQLVALALLVVVRPVHRAGSSLSEPASVVDYERSTFSVMEPPATNDGDSDSDDDCYANG